MQPVQNYISSSAGTLDRVRPKSFPETSASVPALSTSVARSGQGDTPKTLVHTLFDDQTAIEEKLFVALADAKIWTSRLAMHLPRETRDRLFRQIDILHELDEWDENDQPVNLSSYQSLVRTIIYHRINGRPALSLMPNGNVLALWCDGEQKLTIEFLPENRSRWLIQSATESGPERAAGTSPLVRLRDVLAPYRADRWFDGR